MSTDITRWMDRNRFEFFQKYPDRDSPEREAWAEAFRKRKKENWLLLLDLIEKEENRNEPNHKCT